MDVKRIVLSARCLVPRRLFTLYSALGTLLLLLVSCSTIQPPTKIALLAPFEGRYREIGYNALYAARLAMQDAGNTQIELLPIDDGGTEVSATSRVLALRRDPQLAAVLVVGPASTDITALEALEGIASLVVGHWGAQPVVNHVFILASPEIDLQLTLPARIDVTDERLFDTSGRMIGNEILALKQFSVLGGASEDVIVLTSASLPSAGFATRYHDSDPFAPEPGLLASLTYDATSMLVEVVRQHASDRDAVRRALDEITYSGFNGLIQFEDGYWQNAPLHTYSYNADGNLLPVDSVIE